MKEKQPKLVLLMETKLQTHMFDRLKIKLGFESVFMVDSVGRSGGLALFWSNEVEVDIQNYRRRHINVVVKLDSTSPPWKFTGFYGHPDVTK